MIQEFIIYGLIAGSVYALVALGFSLIYNTVRFFHFAHGAVYTVGAYLAFTFFDILKLPFFFSSILAIILTAIIGTGIEFCVYKPMKKRGANATTLLMASLGVFIALQNIISLVYGSDTKTIRYIAIQEGFNFLGARVTIIQIIIIVTSIVLFALLVGILKYTKIGKILRSVSNDPELALAMGIDSQRVIYFTYFVGSALAAVASILTSLDIDINPTIGFSALLYGVVAVIIGGLGNIIGAYFGGLFLGLTQHFGIWFISSKWHDAIAFVILIIFLLFRPQGFFGIKVRKAQI